MKRVALFGAEGALGTALANGLAASFHVTALTPAPVPVDSGSDGVRWQNVDLFSLGQCQEALSGHDTAIFIVNPRVPRTLLVQCRSEDLQLLLADNLIRAARSLGIKQVVMLSSSGSGATSQHIQVQRDTEELMHSSGLPLTVLRAGWIATPGSGVLKRLQRLPDEVSIAGEESKTCLLHVDDVLESVRDAIEDRHIGVYTVPGRSVLTTSEFLAKVRGRPVRFRKVQGRKAAIRWWARALELPRRDASVLYDLVMSDTSPETDLPSLDTSKREVGTQELERALSTPNPRELTRSLTSQMMGVERLVRSVQRVIVPVGWTARDLETAYFEWMGSRFRGLLRVDGRSEEGWTIRGFWGGRLLELDSAHERVGPDRQNLLISGGMLLRKHANEHGWFEFRQLPIGQWAIIALHDFAPAIPWEFYRRSQAVIHVAVMDAFRTWLSSPYRR